MNASMIEYEVAKAVHTAAMRIFTKARDKYRQQLIDDAEFIAAKKEYEEATAIYDAAFAKAATAAI